MDEAAKERLVSNVVGHLSDGVTGPALVRAFQYWRNIDQEIGDRIERGVGHACWGPRPSRTGARSSSGQNVERAAIFPREQSEEVAAL